MGTLLAQIQDDAANDDVAITTLLRRCRVLAARLDNRPLEEWVEHELHGYPEDAVLPPYRGPVPLRLRGSFIGPGWKAENVEVPVSALPEGSVPEPFVKPIRDPLGDVQNLASRDGSVMFSVPADFQPYVDLYQGMKCYALWAEVSPLAFNNVLEQVRNRVLTFALEIEKQNPNAGESGGGGDVIDAQHVTNMTNNIIFGSGMNTLAIASPGAVQTVNVSVSPGDLGALLNYLRSLGVSEPDLAELETALAEDEDERPTDGLGPRVKAWLGGMAMKAATGAWQLAIGTGAQVAGTAIAQYYGLS